MRSVVAEVTDGGVTEGDVVEDNPPLKLSAPSWMAPGRAVTVSTMRFGGVINEKRVGVAGSE